MKAISLKQGKLRPQTSVANAAARIMTIALVPGLAVAAVTSRMSLAQAAQTADAGRSDAGRPDASRSDALIESEVVGALNSSAVLKAQQITAATIDGEVTLSGSVSDAASKEMAGMLVNRVSGVRAVNNNLNIGASGASARPQGDAYGQELPPTRESAQDNPGINSPGDNMQGAPQGNGQYAPQGTQDNGQMSPAPMEAPGAGMPGNPAAPNGPYSSSSGPNSAAQYPQYRYPQSGYPQNGNARNGYPPNGYAQNGYPQTAGGEQSNSGPVQIPQGTLLKVRLSELLDARKAQPGTMFEATAASDVYVGGVLTIPRGAVLDGQVVEVKSPKGSLGGSSSLTLKLDSLVLGGQSYTLETDVWAGNGPGKGGYSANNTVAGAAVGAIIGGIAGGGPGAAIGAAAGGGTGLAASAATNGPRLVLPPETILSFHLANAITVQPVSYQEAQRLASASQQNGPGLQRRAGYGYPGYAYPPPVAYGYPYGYYPYYYPRYRGYYYGGYYGR